MWSEWEGSSGADEVLSVIHRHLTSDLMKETLGCGRVVVICDNCAGQNKHQFMIGFFNELSDPSSEHYLFRRVDIIFPAVGHTFLVNDRAFSVIERFGRGATIHQPADWVNVVGFKAFKTFQYAEQLFRQHFFKWKDYLKPKYSVLSRAVLAPNAGKKIRFSECMRFNLGENGRITHPGILWFKYTLYDDAPWYKSKILRRNGTMLASSLSPW
jgi:hypothetical protein